MMKSIKKTVMMMVALVFSALVASQAMAQPYDQVVNVNFMRQGIQPYTGTNGVGAAVDSGTVWNDIDVGTGPVGTPHALPLPLDSNGGPSGLTLNNSWRFISNNAGATNNFSKGYYYVGNWIVGGGTNEVVPYSIDNMTIGRTYDLFFYLGNDPTGAGGTPAGISVDATGGVVAPDSDNGTGYTPGHDLGIANPTHADWIEGLHYEKLTVTTTATTVSGQFILGDSGMNVNGDNRFFGMQIARVVPEPSSLVLLGMGGLLILRRRWS